VIRVLVIDDSVAFLTAATEVVVAAEGFDLAGVAQSGEEGVEFARLSRPDLALIDLNMPGIDGRETAAQIATESPETVTFLMTATLDSSGRSDDLFDKRRLSPAALAEIWQQAQAPTAR
jgi:two-component system nitrate/nitrite response regulator NarL